ncbi:Fc receptor-like protein 3 [Zonotrichia albicollis]|uniref:Fc receptor-like protein 3 n=1 Tax=Zonotrichia albicollis TaxID=44394 RepID=UPI003D811AA9
MTKRDLSFLFIRKATSEGTATPWAGSGTARATTWYRNGQYCGQEGRDHFSVFKRGTYECHRPGSGRSPPVTVSEDWLVLQVPGWVLLEGDMAILRCRGAWHKNVTSVSFYREGTELRGLPDGAELSLSPLQLNHSGRYSCEGWVEYRGWKESEPVTVTVHELFPVPVLVLEGPPEITEGSPLTLSCRSTPSPLRPRAPLLYLFYQDGRVVGGPQGSPQLLLPAVGVSHSGNYSCEAQSQSGTVRKSSARLRVTVTVPMPVANATITPGPLAHQVHTGDNVTLRCSVQVGSAPVTFTWLHNGHEVAQGPLLELRDIDVGHSGTYQCVATNQLGQDGHSVFQALSPELALEVTPQGHRNTAVAVNVGRALLFLLLLLAVIGGCHWWHRRAARKLQDRSPQAVPLSGPPEVPPRPAPPRDPQVTNAELSGPQKGQRDPRDYESVLWDGKRWLQNGPDHFTVKESGTYTCRRPGTGRSTPVTVSGDDLVLQVPLNHSGRYSCEGRVKYWTSEKWWRSAPVTVRVHELFTVSVLEGPPEITEGSPLTLSCRSTPSPLRPPAPLLYLFYQDGRVLGGPQGSPQLLLPAVGVSHSGNYSCEAQSQGGTVRKSSARLRVTVTVHMPVANATITPGPLAHQVHTGDNVTLRCSVQVGSAPVTFTWLHNGHEVARGPLLELRDIAVGQSGTYQCVATNQLGQDGHRVFQALSPELALEVTPGSPWVTVAAGVSGALLFLLLLVAAIVAWHRWHRVAARKNQERAPPDPPAPPEEGEVLYTHVVVTKRAEASPGATTLQDAQVTYAELRGHQGRSQEPGDIYGNVL